MLLPFLIPRFKIPTFLLIIFFLLFVFGVINIIQGNNTSGQFLKIFIGVSASYLFYYYVVAQFDFDVEKLFKYYLLGCYIVSLIGIFQLVSFKLHFSWGYDFSWILNKWGLVLGGNLGIRVNSVFAKPIYFAACVASGMFISIYNLVMKKSYYLYRFQSAVILLA